MKRSIHQLFLFVLLIGAAGSLKSTFAAAPDSLSAKANRPAAVAPAANAATDEELILDENEKTPAPSVKKSLPAESKPSSTNPPVAPPTQPIVKSAAETGQKKEAAAANPASSDTTPVKIKKLSTDTPATAAKPVADSSVKKSGPTSAAPADTGKIFDKKIIAAPASSKTAAAKDSLKKAADDELILDGGEEDLLGQVKSAHPKTAPASPVAARPGDSGAQKTGGNGANGPTAATPGADTGSHGRPNPTAVTETAPLSTPATPATIEQIHSINFARNLKEYRSPKLAMLLSLFIPGAGQVYTKQNIWAAGFVAVEAGIIGTGVAMSAKANRIKRDAYSYADKHYDVKKFQTYSDSLRKYLSHSLGGSKTGDSIFYALFNDTLSGGKITFMQDAAEKNGQYYSDISGNSSRFIQGWDDVGPSIRADSGFQTIDTSQFAPVKLTVNNQEAYYGFYTKSNPGSLVFGVSANQEHYSSMISDYRQWSNYSRNAFISLLVNHLASAIMAGIQAKAHNDALLGKESFWQRIDLKEQYVNTGSSNTLGYALQVEF
jgi:hypothetical protein